MVQHGRSRFEFIHCFSRLLLYWFIQLNTHGISHNNISKNNFYSSEFELQRIIQNNKWKNHVICGEFNLLTLLVCNYIINYLSIFQHGFNIEIFILLNFVLPYIFLIFSHIAVLCIFLDPNNLRFVFLLAWIFRIILMLMDSTAYIINFGIPYIVQCVVEWMILNSVLVWMCSYIYHYTICQKGYDWWIFIDCIIYANTPMTIAGGFIKKANNSKEKNDVVNTIRIDRIQKNFEWQGNRLER